jgi:DnaK suppressor protein
MPQGRAPVRSQQGAPQVNSRTKARFKTVLEKKRTELALDFNAARSRSVAETSEGDKDYVDYAVSSYTKEFLLSLSDMERRQLVAVEDALISIKDGSYGTCQECEEEIEAKRLDAVPWARYCLECQELADRGLLRDSDEDDD